MRDAGVEKFLDKNRVTYEYRESFPLSKVIVNEKARRNIRLSEQLNEEVVRSYVVALKAGNEFPAIVIAPNGRDLMELVGGLHRMETYDRCNKKTSDVYILGTDDQEVIGRMRRTLNTINGLNYSEEERVLHAIEFVDGGLTRVDAAKLMNVSRDLLHKRLDERQAGARLASGNIDHTAFHGSALRILGRISRDKLLFRAATLAKEARLPADVVNNLVAEVRGAASDDDANKILDDWTKQYEKQMARSAGGAIRPHTSPLRHLPSYYGRIRKAMEADLKLLERSEAKEWAKKLRAWAKECEAWALKLEQLNA